MDRIEIDIAQELKDPSNSYWLKDAIRQSFDRDICNALSDAEFLVDILKQRYNEIASVRGFRGIEE